MNRNTKVTYNTYKTWLQDYRYFNVPSSYKNYLLNHIKHIASPNKIMIKFI